MHCVILRYMRMFPSDSSLQSHLASRILPRYFKPLKPDMDYLKKSYTEKSHTKKSQLTMYSWFPEAKHLTDGKGKAFWYDLQICMISWVTTNDLALLKWVTIKYKSTLPYGWIPTDSMHFIAQFISHLETQWIKFCEAADEHMSNAVG